MTNYFSKNQKENIRYAKEINETDFTSEAPKLEQIYIEAKLSKEQIDGLNKYRAKVEYLIKVSYPQCVMTISDKGSRLEQLSSLILLLDNKLIISNLQKKKDMIAKLFSNSNHIVAKTSEGGLTIGPKRPEHFDTLFEFEILKLHVENGFEIELEPKLPSNSKSEFAVRKTGSDWHDIEAKCLNQGKLHNLIYKNVLDDKFDIPDDDQRKIRDLLKNIIFSARTKFKGCTRNFIIYVNVQFPLNFLGDKARKYMDNYFDNIDDAKLLKIVIYDTVNFYDVKRK